jgi:hydrogenase expression/formation protein HypE
MLRTTRRLIRVRSGALHPVAASPYLRDGSPFRLTAVVFDFDGTLTRPGALDFVALHTAVGCPQDVGLLEFLSSLKDAQERQRVEAILEQAEDEAAERSQANEGAERLVAFLREYGIPMAIITRNRREAVERALANSMGIDPADFALMVTRDLPFSPKPSPEGVLHAARELGVDVHELLMIGDHAFDIEAGERAGALTMFLDNHPEKRVPSGNPDFVVQDLEEAGTVIRYGLPLPMGKLPADLLQESLAGIAPLDPAVLVGAGIGEDAAAMDIGGSEVLVLSSDPVTLAADSLARYAVLVNANDVATSGATPRWFLSTLLFPPGASASEVLATMRDIQTTCAAYGISVCGGHTEITDVVSRPLVVGTMAGTASAKELIDKRQMQEGDRVLMTKRVAVEGTGLIAREFGPRLLGAGMTAAEVAECSEFLERMGILDEARIARSFAGVTALHDVTEGGLAAAVRELGVAGGRRLRLHMEDIPIYPQTRRICAAMDVDPLGLIGSGSLLITCAPIGADELREAMGAEGIEIADIGEVLGLGEGVEALRGTTPAEWPCFDCDEVSRLSRP